MSQRFSTCRVTFSKVSSGIHSSCGSLITSFLYSELLGGTRHLLHKEFVRNLYLFSHTLWKVSHWRASGSFLLVTMLRRLVVRPTKALSNSNKTMFRYFSMFCNYQLKNCVTRAPLLYLKELSSSIFQSCQSVSQ